MTQMERPDFIKLLAPQAAQAWEEGSPMFPSVRLAQNILETGCIVHSWNNLGGIKVGGGSPNQWWKGAVVNKDTWEVINGKEEHPVAAFRAYNSIYDFYKDQDRLFREATIKSGGKVVSRYKRVMDAETPEEQANALYLCGYATDPHYADKIISIIKGSNLTKYDTERMSEEDMKKLEELTQIVQEQAKEIAALREMVNPTESADWIKPLVDELASTAPPILTDKVVSHDFARTLTVLNKVGVFDKFRKGGKKNANSSE
jgi:hypothetical protein